MWQPHPVQHLEKTALLLLATLGFSAAPGHPQGTGAVQGRVVDAVTRSPVVGTNIVAAGTQQGTVSGPDGEYTLPSLGTGTYTILFSHVGYEPRQVDQVAIDQDHRVVRLDVELVEKPIPLSEVTVTPGQFAIMGSQTATQQTLTREDIQTMSQTGDDIYRAIARLPGISGSDFSAKFTVRGGDNEEVLVLLDGLELYEPFHIKDINGGVLSIIDTEAIDGIELMTGGFPAEYGDRTSGVFNIKSASAPAGAQRLSVGASFMNIRLLLEGATDRSAWLLSARRGYLDLVLAL